MDARAVDADEDAVRHGGPRGVLAAAVEAYLSGKMCVNDVKYSDIYPMKHRMVQMINCPPSDKSFCVS